MIFPNKLKKGDTIGVIAPSSPVDPDRVDRCIVMLKNMGYQVKEGAGCRMKYHGYLAGTDEIRARDINQMFADQTVNGIFCLRGGNGSGRLMKLLDYNLIRQSPKVFVGYSDITNFHMAFNQLCGFVTYHGPMVSSNMLEHYDDYTRESFEAVLNMDDYLEFKNPCDEEIKCLIPGYAEGKLIGGNLSLLINMLGTFYAPVMQGAILFIEDIYENISNIDRMVGQLRLLGVFDQIAGLIIGDFSECKNDGDSSFLIDEYIQDEFKDLKIPVLYKVKVGHCYPSGSFPMGAYCILEATEKKIIFVR
jgi:Uncharacterized proteins, homologs of microcin C7 resistance protein MccF